MVYHIQIKPLELTGKAWFNLHCG